MSYHEIKFVMELGTFGMPEVRVASRTEGKVTRKMEEIYEPAGDLSALCSSQSAISLFCFVIHTGKLIQNSHKHKECTL
jgi:hypothetical protein